MGKVTFQWKGVAELKKTYEAVGMKIDDREPELKQIILKPCQAMRDHASELAPQGKTGNLKASLYATVGGPKQRGVMVGTRKKKAPYAPFVEYGTSRMPAQPFFRPALLTMANSFVDDIAPDVKRLVEETAAKNAYHPPK